jgi:hypothetical protein
LPAENARERNSAIGTIGSGARRSQATKAANSSRAGGSDTTVSAPSQPAVLPRRPQTTPSAPPVTSARPRRSSAVSGPRLSSILVSTSGIAIRPIGTLSQKIQCQSMPSTTAPPMKRAAGDREAGDRAEDPDRRTAALGREGGAQERQPSGMISAAPAP